ncbi:MAG TPA: hypothetical protein VE173_07350, partial [Longimicrobiales bacterium]|nr:hypothetical protein [Longimicrobiales bacterium]
GVLALAYGSDPGGVMEAWLTAWIFGISVALGALAFLMIGHVTGARWFVVVRRVAETVVATLPFLALLMLPVLLDLGRLYPWARAGVEGTVTGEPGGRAIWLQPGFFTVRAVACLLVWCAMATALWAWSTGSDEGGGRSRARAPVILSAVGLPVYGVTVTVAAFDWIMSLDPTWSSTMFGIYWFAGGFLASLALLVLLAAGLERAGYLRERVATDHYYALGRLLLTFVVFWAYIAYSQGFLVWIADIPREAEWYVARWDHGWSVVLVLLIVGHFAVPFLALLSRELKRRRRRLVAVAAWLLVVHWIDVYWLVEPSLGRDPLPGWPHLAALAAVLGLSTAWGTWRLRGKQPVPIGDDRLAASAAYVSR